MACSQTIAGLAQDCSNSMGGIKAVWLADYPENLTLTYTGHTDEGGVPHGTGYTNEIIASVKDGNNDVTWHKYYFRKNTASMTSTLTVDAANGVNYVETALNLVFTKMDTCKRIEMAALATADVMAVVEDANGTKWFLGKDNPLACTAGAGETGTSKGDGNKYTLTLTDESMTYPFEFLGTI